MQQFCGLGYQSFRPRRRGISRCSDLCGSSRQVQLFLRRINIFLTCVARWYTREEQPIRQITWFAGTPVFGIFGGLIGYALGHITTGSIASWRYMFIIFGAITMVWGVILFFIFPNDPTSARFLNEEERIAASEIVSSVHQDIKTNVNFGRLWLKVPDLGERGNGRNAARHSSI